MKASGLALGIVFVAAAIFVAATGLDMPAVVASHFGASGRADGAMSQAGYVTFMLGMLLAMALLFGGLPKLLRRLPTRLVNIPNREYWLAPERQEATWDDVEGRLRWFACALLVFLAYVHSLVVLANETKPPALPEGPFIFGLAAFILIVIAWSAGWLVRFKRPR